MTTPRSFLQQISLGLILLGSAFNLWVGFSRFTLARLEDVFILPFWLIWLLIPYAYPTLVMRQDAQTGPAVFSALALLLFCLAAYAPGSGTGMGSINPLISIAACAVAMLAHWLACIVLRRPFALPWRQEQTEERHE